MTMRMLMSRLTLSSAALVVLAGCSEPVTDAATAAATMAGSSAEGAQSDETGALDGAILAPRRIACARPEAPVNGSVHAPQTRVGATASYACASDYALVGDATRRCTRNGTWSGSAPTCAFANAGSPCGACGGLYDADGACSVPTPANLGAPCDVGSGQGACAGAGTLACDGTCAPVEPTVGDPTAWHIAAAANGSWDWNCDGVVTTRWEPTPVPPDCSAYADADGCQGAPTVDFVSQAWPCGQQATVFTRDCQWMTFGPACINTPAQHRVVFQQCR